MSDYWEARCDARDPHATDTRYDRCVYEQYHDGPHRAIDPNQASWIPWLVRLIRAVEARPHYE